MLPVEQWYYEVPLVTRLYATGAVLVALAVQTGFVNVFQLYFDFEHVIYKREYWRPITTFLYFGPLGLDFVFHMFFLVRYSRMLEEGSFYGRTVDYAWMLFLSASALLCLSPVLSMPFLGSPLAFTLVYIWSRRNPSIPLNFLGLFVFTAPYLPWVLLAFTLLLNSHFPTGDLMGIAVGHIYYFFEDVWPKEAHSGGRRYLQTPAFLTRRRGNLEIPAEILEEEYQPPAPTTAATATGVREVQNDTDHAGSTSAGSSTGTATPSASTAPASPLPGSTATNLAAEEAHGAAQTRRGYTLAENH